MFFGQDTETSGKKGWNRNKKNQTGLNTLQERWKKEVHLKVLNLMIRNLVHCAGVFNIKKTMAM